MTWLLILITAIVGLVVVLSRKESSSHRSPSNACNHWIYHPHLMNKNEYECSRCHARFSKQTISCPKCGARLSGKTITEENEWLDEEEELDLICEDD